MVIIPEVLYFFFFLWLITVMQKLTDKDSGGGCGRWDR